MLGPFVLLAALYYGQDLLKNDFSTSEVCLYELLLFIELPSYV